MPPPDNEGAVPGHHPENGLNNLVNNASGVTIDNTRTAPERPLGPPRNDPSIGAMTWTADVLTPAWERGEISVNAFRVGVRVARYCGDWTTGTGSRPGVPVLIAETGIGSSATVRRALRDLRDAGLIVCDNNGGGRNKLAAEYHLTRTPLTNAGDSERSSDDADLTNSAQHAGDSERSSDPVTVNSAHSRTELRSFDHELPADLETQHSSSSTQKNYVPPSAADTPDSDRFEEFVALYPRRVDEDVRRRAEVAWAARLREGITADFLIGAVKRYRDVRAEVVRADPVQRRYTPNPDRWLNTEGWADLPDDRRRNSLNDY